MEKTCQKCKKNKKIVDFVKSKRTKDGFGSECKECLKQRSREYRIKYPERRRATKHKYYTKNKDKHREYNIKYKQTEKYKLTSKLRIKYRKQFDIGFKLKCSLRRRLHHALNGRLKTEKTLNLLGCTLYFLKKYLESKFQEGMSWKNYGHKGWHIDHIKPCASFDLSLPEEQKKCFHYSNLQPLWAKENLKKQDKYINN